ncbi:kinase [Micromonospora sp. DT48]|uniref:kinase n=1 Tax=Micromonospora sp. DT48 TaxID=3393429 RepID=UPI003CE89562
MSSAGVILYGPPAAGKDTVTRELAKIDDKFALFPRLKAGGGRTYGYRLVTPSHFVELRKHGDMIWENRRYNSLYGVDRPALVCFAEHRVPILHLGQIEAIDAVKRSTPGICWVVVCLWCARDVAAERIAARKTGDTLERLIVWDQTQPGIAADLEFDTGKIDPAEVAQQISARIEARRAT